MNLAVNARDSVRAHGGGSVNIRTARLTQSRPGLAIQRPGDQR